MNSSFNASKNNSISDKENSESRLQIQLLSNHKPKAKSMINIKYFKDISYFLFNEIFSDMEFTNIENEKIKINDYEDFYNFQKKLNSYYKSYIKFFDYKNKLNVNIVKEIPYKATRLRELHEENGAITISPNGHFVRTSEIKCESNSTLGHYNTVIANSLILKGVYYYEIKILELGNNTDMCFGIIGRNSEFMNNKRYQNFPLCEFDDCYGFNLNNHFYDKNHHYQKNIKVGTIISIKVDLNKNKIYLYFDGESTGNNSINIKNSNLGYYPAFSLSSGKEIQVRFGGIYNLFLYFKTSNQVDAKPICQYNNLENIVSIYMEIVENCLIKIMNHQQQITYNDSNRFFQPMLNFFANIAFNDEYIMKQYILKFMYKNYLENKDIEKFFDERYIFLYLIVSNIDKNKQQESILFLLNCLCEDIKNYSYITKRNDKIPNVLLLVKLYNYFLQKNLFKEILFPRGKIDVNVSNELKTQLYYIFHSLTIHIGEFERILPIDIMEVSKEKMDKFINNKYYIECFSELIETLLGLKLENSSNKANKIYELREKIKIREKESSEKKNQSSNEIKEDVNDFEVLENYLSKRNNNHSKLSKEQEELINKRKLEDNFYRKIFFELINENLENKSENNIYNLISTIYLPLLHLFNNYYEAENFYNYSNKNIFSYLPTLFNEYLNAQSKLFTCDRLILNENRKKPLEDIIDSKILYQELHEKEYNISSFLIQLLINLSSLFNDNLFEFNLYLQRNEYRKIVKRWKFKSDFFKMNKYINNMNKLVSLSNSFNYNIIKIALNNLIPYFIELLNNNFYLFLPEQFIKMIKFFIKFLAYHLFIFNDSTSIKNENTKMLIKLFVDLNFKLLFDKNTNGYLYIEALDNIKFIYSLLLLINVHLKDIIIDDENEINLSNSKEITDFKYYIKDDNFFMLVHLTKREIERNDELDKNYFSEFILYFNPFIFLTHVDKNEKNIMISYIVNYIKNVEDENDFWIKTYVIELLTKNKLIKKIKKAENIINDYQQIDEEKKEKLKKYFALMTKILYFISNFIKNDYILEKYFNLYVEKKDSILEEDIQDEESFRKEKESENKLSIYCSFITLAQLIIKFLENKNLSEFCKKKINYLNKHDFNVKILIRECFGFLSTIFVTIPKKYEMMIEKKEKNKNKGKKKKNKKNEEVEKEKEKEFNEDLMHFYSKIINNIKVNDIMRLSSLLENNAIMRSSMEERKSQLRKIIKFYNEIETKYNLFPKESHSLEESQDSNICAICLDKENDSHLNPCQHMFCFSCIQKLNDRRCPICRKTIIGVLEHPEFKFIDQNNINNNNNNINNNNNNNRRIIRISNRNEFNFNRNEFNLNRNANLNNPFLRRGEVIFYNPNVFQ